ncbi:MAG: rsbU 7 [Bacteroidetes bacterium]|jgi:ligand-binding sensor domain-containing protein/serine phosphatase RsbU (regulator of sigma subunit)|nr:rsbU 7 [Bacteroidota bacterium]
MVRVYLPYLLVFCFLFSCKESGNKKNVNVNESNEVAVSSTKPIVVIHRAKTSFTEAKKPVSVNAAKAKTFPANANVIGVDDLTTSDVPAQLTIFTPGTDTFPMPKVITASVITVPCRQPVPVTAMPPRFKDAAISDIKYLDVDQGMSSSFIKSVLSDKAGNLWFGTNGGGVSRYDGRTFLHFTEKNGLSNNKVLTIYQDKSGNMWFGTEGGGVCCYDGEKFTWITEDEGLGNNTVLSICQDKSGKMWFGTNGGGVNCYDGKTLTTYTEKEGLSNGSVRVILEDKNGNMWFGTTGSGACMFNGKSFTYFGENEGFNSTIIHTIIEAKDGKLYFGTEDGGVNIYDGKTVKFITAKRGLSSNCIVSLHEDKWENIWIGTYDSGLCKYDGKQITVYSTQQGLTNNYILAMCEDNSGSLWLGTLGGGVCRFNNGSFNHYTEKEGIGSNTVRSMVQDSSGHIWFGTFGDGAIYYDGSSFNHYTEAEGMPSSRIKASAVDGNYIWFGTEENGAVRFNGKTFENFTREQGLNSNYILSMCRDKSGRIWFGADEGGVCCYDGMQFMSLIDEEGLSEGIITSIIQDKSGNMWFGTDGYGACCYDGKFLKWYTTKSGLCGNVIKYIFEDKDGNIWFGSEGKGVSVLRASTINTREPSFQTHTEKEGLSSNLIRSIIQDNSGNVWIATERGLNYMVEKNGKKEFHVYTSADGLKANNFYYTALIDKNNTIWWGNGKALTNLNLNNYKLPSVAPFIQMTGLQLEQTFIDFYSLQDTLKKGGKVVVGEKDKKNLKSVEFKDVERFYNYPTNLSLPYNINHLDFHFSAIDWIAADKIEYQYMLSGTDEDWSPMTSDNRASFNNLSHGSYVFKVKAIGVASTWSQVFEYPFTIRPPWYRTIWAYAFYVIAFFGIVVGFNNVRTRQLKIRQQELEQTVAERTAEVVEQKELIEEKQKEIVDSINYAKRIQSAMLASEQLFTKNLKNYFVLFEPKDIVSGDFYWASPVADGRFALVTADSTGHGVPGAMMSMLNISCLNEAVSERKFTSPAAILGHARQRIISSLAEDGSAEGGKDGMDCSVTIFDFQNKRLTYAAANNPVWIVRALKGDETPLPEGDKAIRNSTHELLELKPDRMPVGKHSKDNVPFSEQVFELQAGDVVYTLTDGFCDQFGGPKQKKFTYKKLKEILLQIATNETKAQKVYLKKTFDDWRGTLEQVDDVLIIGVKI